MDFKSLMVLSRKETMTYEEWDVLFQAMKLKKKKRVKFISDFWRPRFKEILASEGLLPFEKEPEITYYEYLILKQSMDNPI